MSQTSAMRLSTICIVLCLVGLTAAAPWATCPNPSTTDTYAPATQSSCALYQGCVSVYCECQGATGANSTTNECIWGPSRPNCTLATVCTAALISCINQAANTTQCSSEFMTLRMGLVGLANGAFYNGSQTERACQKHACLQFNKSVTEPTCNNISYTNICTAPYVYVGRLVISGDWTAILANSTARALLIISLREDLTRQLGIAVRIISVTAGSLIVEFEVAVAPSNPALQQAIADAQTNSSWLTNTQSTYQSNGGSGSLTVQGITEITTAPPTSFPPTTPPPTTVPAPDSVGAYSIATAAVVLVSTLLLLS